ncbi:glycosyltransferase [Candidatus Gracilibacteria bacterium]|nr:glycosyltransferase [Candidatus Gracilibacteria bacterium]
MKGGAERMNIEIAKILDADIATAVWSGECYDARSMGYIGEIFEVDPDFQRGMIGFLRMKWRFYQTRHITANYDSILFSNEAITGVWKTKPNTKTYYYAHSISRHLFDQRNQYLAKVPFLSRPFFLLFSIFLRYLYKKELSKIDTIFVNSEANKRRMSEWCGRSDAVLIYPSVDTDQFDIFSETSVSQILAIEGIMLQSKQYYLSFSRLTHAKRIDSIIRSFQQTPEKNILILYGENDSQKDEFLYLGKGYPNIIFHKLIDNNHLSYIISGSIASICVSKYEDFGMVAIESMACGIPVIAVNEGGYRESIGEGKTGYLVDPENLEQNITSIIQNIDPDTFRAMEADCRRRSLDFSLQQMNIKIKQFIQ